MSNPTELPDLDTLELRELLNEWHLCFGRPGQKSTYAKLLAHIATLARRAQPEGEAPQAEAKEVRYLLTNALPVLDREYRSLAHEVRQYLAKQPAATLSPLCGAQHAESGKEKELGCGGSGKCGVGHLPCLGCVNCPSEDDVQKADVERLMFAMQDIDGFVSVKQDKYDLAVVVMEERGFDEPNWECELEGIRRLIDKAMAAPSHTTNKEK